MGIINGNENKTRLNQGSGMGMGMNHWEWEGIGLKKTFLLISMYKAELTVGHIRVATDAGLDLWVITRTLCGVSKYVPMSKYRQSLAVRYRSEQLLGAWNAGKDRPEQQDTVSFLHTRRPQQDRQLSRRPAKGPMNFTYHCIFVLFFICSVFKPHAEHRSMTTFTFCLRVWKIWYNTTYFGMFDDFCPGQDVTQGQNRTNYIT